ncbi:hypothetical protein F9278_40885 [Streptomyces phaeolivaceus]|uniref:Uncharacterized protein n=1 Tax=Streptomyces phaeolivaceus TaxID=2653200 RepID=A0A5P8KDU4_9ACTN|nr:hypothetical protein F9278_40885 [Streptomyces phaeolivaceus]
MALLGVVWAAEWRGEEGRRGEGRRGEERRGAEAGGGGSGRGRREQRGLLNSWSVLHRAGTGRTRRCRRGGP